MMLDLFIQDRLLLSQTCDKDFSTPTLVIASVSAKQPKSPQGFALNLIQLLLHTPYREE